MCSHQAGRCDVETVVADSDAIGRQRNLLYFSFTCPPLQMSDFLCGSLLDLNFTEPLPGIEVDS